jgi:hypothetical protein
MLGSDARDESWIQGRHDRGSTEGGVLEAMVRSTEGSTNLKELRDQEWDPHLERRSGQRLGRRLVPQRDHGKETGWGPQSQQGGAATGARGGDENRMAILSFD